jgi:hypothetical protein
MFTSAGELSGVRPGIAWSGQVLAGASPRRMTGLDGDELGRTREQTDDRERRLAAN